MWLKFNDGLEGEVELASELRGEVFEPLRDTAYFASFRVEETLTWPNGADFAPEFLHVLNLDVHGEALGYEVQLVAKSFHQHAAVALNLFDPFIYFIETTI